MAEIPTGLLPCPHCGGAADGVEDRNEGIAYTPEYFVACRRCNFSTLGFREHTEAIAAWNHRPSPEQPLALVCECGHRASQHAGDEPLQVANAHCTIVGCACPEYRDISRRKPSRSGRPAGTDETPSSDPLRAFLDAMPEYVPATGAALLAEMRAEIMSPYAPWSKEYQARADAALTAGIEAIAALAASREDREKDAEALAAADEIANELEASVKAEHHWPNVHPALQHKFDRDMTTIIAYRAARASSGKSTGSDA